MISNLIWNDHFSAKPKVVLLQGHCKGHASAGHFNCLWSGTLDNGLATSSLAAYRKAMGWNKPLLKAPFKMITAGLNIDAVVALLRHCRGTDFYALAKCNCILNLVTLMEVHLREKVLGGGQTDRLLDGDFGANLLGTSLAGRTDREILLSLLEIRNCFVHEGVIADITDEEIDQFIGLTKSILTT